VRPIPIPDEVLAANPACRRVVIGENDPTRDDVRPCEYLVGPSTLYPGLPAVTALIELDDEDRAVLAAGGRLFLTLDGGELPWSIETVST
jgi:hypothetical protein